MINKNNILKINLIIGLFIVISTSIYSIIDSMPNLFAIIIPETGEKYVDELYSFFGPAYTLTYYTFQTNYIIGAVLILSFFKIKTKSFDSFFMMAVSYIVFTFFIYWTAIVPFSPSYKWNNAYWVIKNLWVHFINPLLGFYVLFLNRNIIFPKVKYIKWFSLYPMIFIAYAALVFYLGGSIEIDADGKPYFVGQYIYGFLIVDSPIFINLENNHLAALYVYFFIMVIAPFLISIVALVFSIIYKINLDTKFWWYTPKNNGVIIEYKRKETR